MQAPWSLVQTLRVPMSPGIKRAGCVPAALLDYTRNNHTELSDSWGFFKTSRVIHNFPNITIKSLHYIFIETERVSEGCGRGEDMFIPEARVEVTGKLEWLCFLLPPCGSCRLNSSHQAWLSGKCLNTLSHLPFHLPQTILIVMICWVHYKQQVHFVSLTFTPNCQAYYIWNSEIKFRQCKFFFI